eukprot:scaffold1397_cov254-Pinguiococcus_pyrenoidosus.AAC.64
MKALLRCPCSSPGGAFATPKACKAARGALPLSSSARGGRSGTGSRGSNPVCAAPRSTPSLRWDTSAARCSISTLPVFS